MQMYVLFQGALNSEKQTCFKVKKKKNQEKKTAAYAGPHLTLEI